MHYKNGKIHSIKDLKDLFPSGEADGLNWCIFSTSGVHGSYFTLDEIEYSLRENLDEYSVHYCRPRLTVLVIKPRMVSLGWGEIEVALEDVPFLRTLGETSLACIKQSQKGNMLKKRNEGGR